MPMGRIDTRGRNGALFQAASLRGLTLYYGPDSCANCVMMGTFKFPGNVIICPKKGVC
jgi:hypothetical protein